MFNDSEIKLIAIIERARGYVKGEVEIDCIDGKWYARDYREDLGGAFPIETEPYISPIITDDEAEDKGIDIIKCCEMCGVYYVG